MSLALRLKNRKSGMNHTQMAKNVATSRKVGASLYALVCAEYLYLAALYFLASCATPAK